MPAYLDPVEEAQVATWVLMAPEPLKISEEVIVLKCEITIAARDGLQPGFDIRKLDRVWLRVHAEEIQRLVRRQVRHLKGMDQMGSHFIPDRCALISTLGSNVLIRGNMPLIAPDNHYALEEIQAASGVEDLLSRIIVEVPIIDNVGERAQFEPLCLAFGIDPNQFPASDWPPYGQRGYNPNALMGSLLTTEGHTMPGRLMWRPFEGLPANTDPDTYLNSPLWDFSGFVDQIHTLMRTQENAAIYVHCQLGADRTGAFHIGYLMKYGHYSLETAIRLASQSTKAGLPNADYMRLVEAYAQSLPKNRIIKSF